MNSLLKSIVLMLVLTGCVATKFQSPKSKVQSPAPVVYSWWMAEPKGASIMPTINQVSKSINLIVAKPPVVMIRLSWNTEWRDEKGNVQPDAVSIVRSSTSLQTVYQGTIRLVARTNQIVVPRTEQQEFFVVANDYGRNYSVSTN